VTDLLEAASAALGTPRDLVQRSAAARAAASGVPVEEILAAWAGGAPAPAPAAPPAAAPEPSATEPEPSDGGAAVEQEQAAAVEVLDQPAVAAEPEIVYEPEPEQKLEPVPLGTRVKTAVRIGAWVGAALGVVGFLVATAWWAPNTTFLETGPVLQVNPNGVVIGAAILSVFFGAFVAGISRAATAWSNPAMQLSNSKASTPWIGAIVGLLLGVVAGAMLNGFGTPVEGSDPPLVQLPVLATLFVMVLGGAVLGALTALVPQLLGTPVAVEDEVEVSTVKRRLANAVSVPLAGILLLLLLVLPFGFTLIQSNHVAPGIGGAVVAIITAAGILGFAALAGSRPRIRITFGDVMVAVIGIGVVLIIIISVLFARSGDEHAEEAGGEEAAAALLV
jgi:MFS family permease